MDLKKFLLKTGESKLVEASPTDKRWGAGISLRNSDIFNQSKWQGENWLGDILQKVREELKQGV